MRRFLVLIAVLASGSLWMQSVAFAAPVTVSSYSYDNTGDLLNATGFDTNYAVGIGTLNSALGGLTNGVGQADTYVPGTFFWSSPEQGTILLNDDAGITAGEASPEITFDFGSPQDVQAVTIHYGIRTASAVVAPEMVEVLVDNVSVGTFGGFDTSASANNFGDIRSNTVLIGAQNGQNVTIRLIGGISGLPAAAGTTWHGLTEVEFDSVPEPASLMLLVAGGVLVSRRRRSA